MRRKSQDRMARSLGRAENSASVFHMINDDDKVGILNRLTPRPPMSRVALLSFSILLLCVVAFLLSLNGCSSGFSTSTSPPAKIEHVVIIFQENRTPDNLFQDPNLI